MKGIKLFKDFAALYPWLLFFFFFALGVIWINIYYADEPELFEYGAELGKLSYDLSVGYLLTVIFFYFINHVWTQNKVDREFELIRYCWRIINTGQYMVDLLNIKCEGFPKYIHIKEELHKRKWANLDEPPNTIFSPQKGIKQHLQELKTLLEKIDEHDHYLNPNIKSQLEIIKRNELLNYRRENYEGNQWNELMQGCSHQFLMLCIALRNLDRVLFQVSESYRASHPYIWMRYEGEDYIDPKTAEQNEF